MKGQYETNNRFCEIAIWGRLSIIIAAASFLGGCLASLNDGPPRLSPVEDETAVIRKQYGKPDPAYISWTEGQKVAYRDELVTQRMYAIDIQYSSYETALTQERQQLGFLSTTSNLALTGAATLIGPVQTKNIWGLSP